MPSGRTRLRDPRGLPAKITSVVGWIAGATLYSSAASPGPVLFGAWRSVCLSSLSWASAAGFVALGPSCASGAGLACSSGIMPSLENNDTPVWVGALQKRWLGSLALTSSGRPVSALGAARIICDGDSGACPSNSRSGRLGGMTHGLRCVAPLVAVVVMAARRPPPPALSGGQLCRDENHRPSWRLFRPGALARGGGPNWWLASKAVNNCTRCGRNVCPCLAAGSSVTLR